MASLEKHSGILDRRMSAHLVRRTTYNPSKERIYHYKDLEVSTAVDELLGEQTFSMDEPIDPLTLAPFISTQETPPQSSNGNLRNFVRVWWLHEALVDKTAKSKLTFFLHTNYTIQIFSGNYYDAHDYLSFLRYYAYGNFQTLAVKMTLCNLMLKFLDNKDNNANNPNENYAREFLELFTIGKGPQIGDGDYTNYTEDDVVQAARVLSGLKTSSNREINIDPISGIPYGRAQYSQHDQNDKTFSHAFQNHTISAAIDSSDMFRELEDFVQMVFDQDETARAFCRKLYRFYVSRNISEEIENDIIEPLAVIFRNSNYNIKTALKTLLESQHFYDLDDSDNTDEIIGGLVKSPLDLVLGALNYFKMEIPDALTDANNHYHEFYRKSVLQVMFENASFDIFNPNVVAGYPAYYQAPEYDKNWFNSTTIITRYKLPQMLLEGKRILSGGDLGGVQLNIVDFIADGSNIANPGDANHLVDTLTQLIFCENLDSGRKNYFKNDIFLDGLSEVNWLVEWLFYIDNQDDTNIKIPLTEFATAIMYSQEYQLM